MKKMAFGLIFLILFTAGWMMQTNQNNFPSSQGLALTNGQLAIGSTGAAPVPGTITPGAGIAVTNGAGTITTALKWVCTPSLPASDTVTNASGAGTDFFFATTCAIPANQLNANSTLLIDLGFVLTSSSSPSFNFKVWVCQVSGCASGTTANLYASGAHVPTAITGNGAGAIYMLQSAGAAGSSVNVTLNCLNCAGAGSSSLVLTPNGGNGTAQPVAINTSVTEYISFSLNISANTAGNSMTIQQAAVQQVN
jgi:hypothetical protein